MSEAVLQITVPEGAGNTLYTECDSCALCYICPNGYMGNSFCNRFDFGKAKVRIMKGNKAIKTSGVPSDEDLAWLGDMLYHARMMQMAQRVPSDFTGAYVRQPITPSMLKGHQRMEEYRRQKNAENLSKEAIKSEISRLQGMLDAMEEEDKNNTPHKQLNLFE